MNEEDKMIGLRCEEFQDVLGDIPPLILRWGIMILLVIVIIILIGSSIFKYPDVINSSMTLTGSAPPATIVAKSSGKLTELFVKDNQMVTIGSYLAVVENSACTSDILELKEYLRTIKLDDTDCSLPPKDLQLGNIQPLYSSFYITLFEYAEYKRFKYYKQKLKLIQDRIIQYEIQYKNGLRQKKIIADQLIITQKQFQRDSVLNRKGILSLEDLENTQRQYLQSMLAYENISTSIEDIKIQTFQMKESLLDSENQDIEKMNALESKLKTFLTQLHTELQSWEINNVLTAPIDGKITFTSFWIINQNIKVGDEIFNILPKDKGKIIGKASLPIARSGKVKIGQSVNIRFENFPDNEFGIVRGHVQNISLVPTRGKDGSNYIVEIELPEDLRTSYNKKLPYLPEMQARAEIITDNRSLLERFILPLKKVIIENL